MQVHELQRCTVSDIIGGVPCLRLARWRWEPLEDHPVFLCNFHAEPLLPGPAQ